MQRNHKWLQIKQQETLWETRHEGRNPNFSTSSGTLQTLAFCQVWGEGRYTWPTWMGSSLTRVMVKQVPPVCLYFLVFISYTDGNFTILHSCGTKNHEACFFII